MLIFKYFFIIICYFYTYIKLLNIKIKNIFLYTVLFICICTLSLVSYKISKYSVSLGIIALPILSFIFATILFNTNSNISFNTTLISYSISFICYAFAGTIICFLFILFFRTAQSLPYLYTHIPIGVFQSFCTYHLLHAKRFRSGVSILIKEKYRYTGLIITISFLSYIIFFSSELKSQLYIRTIINILFISFSSLLLFYWRHRIKQTYIENLRRLENLTYENTIADKDKQIKELEANNAYLAQIIHKYRKVIPAMELSVMELLQNNGNWDTNTLKSNAQALQVQLEELRAERNNLLDNYQKDMVVTPQSGLHTIDAMIALMEKQAKEQWVRYKTQIDPSIKELALTSIKEADLLHLLGDLIENALHAVNESDHKEILIHISKLNGCLLLEVSDSGAAFDIETYQHFGNEPFTSHEADGGSGTGLMEIWKLKKEYKISLYIYEYEIDSNVYTKKISFLFDKKNHFLLKTFRDKEVKNALIRGDLHVFPHKND